jgi:hypothetical protein
MNSGSKKFIDWAMNDITSDKGWNYHEYFRKFIARLHYYETHPKDFLSKLEAKLTESAKTYGDPKEGKKKYDIQHEIDMEIIDGVAGWPLVKKYLEN